MFTWVAYALSSWARRNEAPEPREALIVDINNDGKNDLVVLVHDRIIVYPQE